MVKLLYCFIWLKIISEFASWMLYSFSKEYYYIGVTWYIERQWEKLKIYWFRIKPKKFLLSVLNVCEWYIGFWGQYQEILSLLQLKRSFTCAHCRLFHFNHKPMTSAKKGNRKIDRIIAYGTLNRKAISFYFHFKTRI